MSFKNNNEKEIKSFINDNGFGILISPIDVRPWGTHIPMLLDSDENGNDILTGHISKANKQWLYFGEQKEVLAIFLGPHTYISSSWYDHENSPTWNYTAVHAYGTISITKGETLLNHLGKMVDKYEKGMKSPISLNSMSKPFVESELRGIIGFQIKVNEFHSVSKLSQNRDDKNYKRIIEELDERNDFNAQKVSEQMKNLRNLK